MTDEEKRKAERMRRDLADTAKMVLCSILISGRYTQEAPAFLATRSHEIATAFLREVSKYDDGD